MLVNDRGTVFVAAHHDLQEVLPRLFGRRFQSHVVDGHQIGFEIATQGLVLLFEGLVFHEVAHQIEDGAVKDFLALLDRLVAQGLGQMRFADARRAEQQNIFALAE